MLLLAALVVLFLLACIGRQRCVVALSSMEALQDAQHACLVLAAGCRALELLCYVLAAPAETGKDRKSRGGTQERRSTAAALPVEALRAALAVLLVARQ
jgi:hypothetical protein